MCDCPEIQDMRGEVWIAHGESIEYSHHDIYYKCLTKDRNRWHCIWLPRQDQLQAMINPEHMQGIVSFSLIRRFSNFCLPEVVIYAESMEAYKECEDEKKKRAYEKRIEAGYEHQRYIAQFTSMEQLWLAFVMKEKHGKVWSDDQWVKTP